VKDFEEIPRLERKTNNNNNKNKNNNNNNDDVLLVKHAPSI
jgi:hypothetical protein